jgi:two-component system, sensor histidine kinase and response regulator
MSIVHIMREYFSGGLSGERLSCRISLVLGTAVLLFMSMMAVLLRMPTAATLLLFFATMFSIGAIVLEKKYGNQRWLIIGYLSIIYLIVLPIISLLIPNAIYDFSVYFIMGVAFAAIMLKSVHAAVFIVVELGVDTFCIYRMIQNTTGSMADFNEFQLYNAPLYCRIIFSLLMTGSVCGILVTYRNKILRGEIRKCTEMERQAEEVNYAKDMFLVNVSHEIRTPLNAILGTSELLMDGEAGENVRESALHIANASRALLSITNDLMSFSKLDYDNVQTENAKYSLRMLLEELINTLSVRLADNRIEPFVEIEPELPQELIGDSALLKQIIMGFVTGVVKSMQEGEIRLGAKVGNIREGKLTLVIYMKARGTFQHSYKDLLYAKEKHEKDNREPLLLQIAEVMEGEFDFSETPYERSYQFCVPQSVESEIPLIQPYENEKKVLFYENSPKQADFLEQVLERMQISCTKISTNERFYEECVKEEYQYLLIAAERYDALKERLGEILQPQSLILISPEDAFYDDEFIKYTLSRPVNCLSLDALFSNKKSQALLRKTYRGNFICPDAKIMVVDDNLINLDVASGILGRYKAQVIVAVSGMECLTTLGQEDVDLIFLDYMMPEMDGIDTLKNIKAMDKEGMDRIPVIALTANAVSGAREMFLEAGFDEYISKPIELDKFDKVLREYLPEEKLRFTSEKEAGDHE